MNESNIHPKYELCDDDQRIEITSGFSCFEVLDRAGKTISGNVTHTAEIRNEARRILARANAPRTIEQIMADLRDAKCRVTMFEAGLISDDGAWDDFERFEEELQEAEGRKVGTDHGPCHACPMDGRLLTDTDGSVRCNACGHIAFG